MRQGIPGVEPRQRLIQRLLLRLDGLSKADHRILTQGFRRRFLQETGKLLVATEDGSRKQLIDERSYIPFEAAVDLSEIVRLRLLAHPLPIGRQHRLRYLPIHLHGIILVSERMISLLQSG